MQWKQVRVGPVPVDGRSELFPAGADGSWRFGLLTALEPAPVVGRHQLELSL